MPTSMEATSTHQLFSATCRAILRTTSGLAPAVAENTGAPLSGLMIGSRVSGTRTRDLKKAGANVTGSPEGNRGSSA